MNQNNTGNLEKDKIKHYLEKPLGSNKNSVENSEFSEEDMNSLKLFVSGLINRQNLDGIEGRCLKIINARRVIDLTNKLTLRNKHLILGKLFLSEMQRYISTEKVFSTAREQLETVVLEKEDLSE